MSALQAELGAAAGRVQARLEALRAAGFHRRLRARDDSLWGAEPERRRVASERLGWVAAPATMRERAAEFAAFAREAVSAGYSRVLLLGMGGSSLAPEVLSRTFGTRGGGLPLTVLDDTSPASVRAAVAASDPARTLVLVASKSGGTIEVSSFESVFFARAQSALGDKAGGPFVAITDPGTALEAQARSKHYRQVFTNPADVGGRYSALTCFGLVPAALLGLDVAALCGEALAERDAFARDGGDALQLGASLGELALAGRDKLTLVLSPELASLGVWVEQLVAESTGKEGRGILPVEGERLAEPGAYGGDRVFVAVGLGALPAATTRALDALAAAGHPVLRWTRDRLEEVGAEFLRWEIATAVAGAVLGVNPFDEPNVAEAKAATRTVLQGIAATGTLPAHDPRARDGALSLFAPATLELVGTDARAWAGAFLRQLGPGDYAAVLAYLQRTPARHAALDRLRHALRAGSRAATTLGYGPRYLHSTGQLHKGGPRTGVFLEITSEEGDEPIPGQRYGFRVLRDAQAAGDFDVLSAHGLRVARVHVSGDTDAGLARLADAFEAAVAARA
jgi:glucose-6-phosphate isomerase/transaldolase/glucose-6-phosphate isomerase